ncbi:MAG: sensor histidine kinase [Bacteroidia bacterium]|nr:sensor histidine kinase [Bacteroidia bacterium]
MKKSVIALLHLGYWLIFLLLISFIVWAFSLPQINKGSTIQIGSIIFRLVLFAGIPGLLTFYSFYTFIFKRYFITKKILKLIAVGIITSIFYGSIGTIIIAIMSLRYNDGNGFTDWYAFAISFTVIISISSLLNGIIGLVMRGFISSYDDITLKEDLNKKNYEMELTLIKNQINPHFLFNTINNIDVLIQKDAVKASEYLNKLSDIMRFMLYETKADKIELAKELTYIEKYIELQKIRSSNNTYVNYILEGNANNLLIEPMLFIPFIENAFKHTENKSLENAITVKISIHKEMIIFECDNKYNVSSKSKSEQNGLGNGLIEKRLQLLYPNNHTLEISEENNIYKVKLTLNNVN